MLNFDLKWKYEEILLNYWGKKQIFFVIFYPFLENNNEFMNHQGKKFLNFPHNFIFIKLFLFFSKKLNLCYLILVIFISHSTFVFYIFQQPQRILLLIKNTSFCIACYKIFFLIYVKQTRIMMLKKALLVHIFSWINCMSFEMKWRKMRELELLLMKYISKKKNFYSRVFLMKYLFLNFFLWNFMIFSLDIRYLYCKNSQI